MAIASRETVTSAASQLPSVIATNGYVLHTLDVATEKCGRVTINEEGLFQVEESDTMPLIASTLPQREPLASIVVSAEAMKQAVFGQEGFVWLGLYGESQSLELASAGKYTLVVPVLYRLDELRWRPTIWNG